MSSKSFDYIIIGAGSAGCVLAHRLTEDPDVSVLVLEAGGPDRNLFIHIPAGSPRLHHSSVDWQMETEPQAQCHNRRIYIPRGKTLGGSSSTNTMIYIRGQPEDYDGWAAAGCKGWAWSDMLPFFKRSEDHSDKSGPLHGRGGPLHVERSNLYYENPLWRAFIEAGQALGYGETSDFNGETQAGFGYFDTTTKDGRRMSTARAFLKPAMRRKNLEVRTHARTTRIVVENEAARAVEYRQGERTHRVTAQREVLLCAGAIHSPQILMLSGIGPSAHLDDIGVDVVHDLPGVGGNLQDHPILVNSYACTKPVSLNRADTWGNRLRYALKRDGPFASVMPPVGAFVRSNDDLDRPDLEFHFVAGWSHDIHDYDARPSEDGFSLLPVLLRPRSRGTIRLRSSDVRDAPRIDPRFLEPEADRQALIAGYRQAVALANHKAFDDYRGRSLIPDRELKTNAEILGHIRSNVHTTYHPAGTCKMGADDAAVVDAQLRVRGLQGLRVIDCSITPTIPSGNTNAPVIAVAEKAADLIRST